MVVNEAMHTGCPAVHVDVIVHVDCHRKWLQDMLQDIVHTLPHTNYVQVYSVVVHGAIR